MKHIKLFEEFIQLNEGAIPVYPAGNPWKQEGSIRWNDVGKHLTNWMKDGTAISVVAEFDANKYSADAKFKSIPMGTYKDKDKPKFSSAHANYDEGDFDVVGIQENPDKPEKVGEYWREPWIRLADKNGLEFLIPPFKILDVQKGSSIRDKVISGHAYLVDDMRAKITNVKNGNVELTFQNKTKKEIPIAEWKNKRYLELGESVNTDNFESLD